MKLCLQLAFWVAFFVFCAPLAFMALIFCLILICREDRETK